MELTVGAVLHYRGWKFADGTQRNKYLVVLGAKGGGNYLCVLTTSQSSIRKADDGCHGTPYSYYFITGNRKNFFPKDTWLLLSEPCVISRKEMQKDIQSIIQIKANLSDSITMHICNCLRKSYDVSDSMKNLL